MRANIRIPVATVLLGLVMAICGTGIVSRGLGSQKNVGEPQNKKQRANTEDQTTGSVGGRLIDELGTAVAKARVWLVVEEKWDSHWQGPPVIAEAFSTDDGRFELKPLKSKVDQFVKGESTTFQIWVWKPHFALTRHVTRTTIPDQPVEIRLRSEPTNEFQLKNPDGTPCSNATVTVTVVKFPDDDYQAVPITIRRRLEVHSNVDGKFTVRGLGRENIVGLHFETPTYGGQYYGFYGRGRRIPTTHQLRKTGSIAGRLVLPPGSHADLSPVTLRIVTLESTQHGQDESRAAFALLQPDREGKFSIPAIAEGTIRVFSEEPDSFAFRSSPQPEGLTVKAGMKAVLEIPLSPAIRVTRQIRESATGKPIPGVCAHLQHGVQHINARTDQEGRFTAWILPGVQYHTVYDYPDEYILRLTRDIDVMKAPADSTEHEFPPIELMHGRTIEGTVVDPKDQPLAGVRVGANWLDSGEDFGFATVRVALNARRWGTTDSAGRFRITGIFPKGNITVTPVRAEVVLCKGVKVAADENQPVELKTDPFDFVSLTGRILDQKANPVAGAEIVIQFRDGDKIRHAWRGVTDAQGRFTTPTHFPKHLTYRVTVQSQYQDVSSSPWHDSAKAGEPLPDFSVDRSKLILREVAP